MQLRTRLNIILYASVLLVLGLLTFILYSYSSNSKFNERSNAASSLVISVAGLVTLNQEYAAQPLPRVLQQWQILYATIEATLHSEVLIGDSGDAVLLIRMQERARNIDAVFTRITKSTPGTDLHLLLQRALSAESQSLENEAYRLHQTNLMKLHATRPAPFAPCSSSCSPICLPSCLHC